MLGDAPGLPSGVVIERMRRGVIVFTHNVCQLSVGNP
jgi:hypothetical protein